jgi:rhodanese-related sulfurtransferase
MKKIATTLLITLLLSSITAPLFALDASNVPEPKRTDLGLYLDAKEAYAMASDSKLLFVDVRTPEEVNYLGMPTVADTNIPLKLVDKTYQWDEKKKALKLGMNKDFVAQVTEHLKAKGLTKADPIILMCRSGDRSAVAANLLAKAGYSKVYSLVDGFEGDLAKEGESKGKRTVNGWKNANLPWTYELTKEKLNLK